MQSKGSPISNKRILLAEDCEDSREVLKFLFAKSGATVEAVEDGKSCVNLALNALKENKPFDFIVLDVHMPILGGNEATRQLRAQGYNLPIVAMTGQVSEEEERICRDSGCNAFMSKLSSKDNMLGILEGLLPKDSPEDSIPALPFVPDTLKSEPHYAPMVLKFIDSLDPKVDKLDSEISSSQWEEARSTCSSLSASSLYGYKIFADTLLHLQGAIEDHDADLIQHYFKMLRQASKSIKLGKKEVQKIAKQ